MDFYSAKIVSEEFHLLDFWPEPGTYTLRLECVGKNAQSAGLLSAASSPCACASAVRAWPRWATTRTRTGRRNPSCTAEPVVREPFAARTLKSLRTHHQEFKFTMSITKLSYWKRVALHVGLASGAVIASVSSAAGAPAVTTASLIEEMTDLAGMASFPSPAYTCKQFSSYDRKSKSPRTKPRAAGSPTATAGSISARKTGRGARNT